MDHRAKKNQILKPPSTAKITSVNNPLVLIVQKKAATAIAAIASVGYVKLLLEMSWQNFEKREKHGFWKRLV